MANKERELNKGGPRRENEPRREEHGKGSMTVTEAGHKGGQRERELVQEGHREEGGKNRR